MSWYDHPWYYAPTKPIEVKGGIKSQIKRGDIASQWWSKRWIDVLETIGKYEYSFDSNRLARGRSYARRGQVMDIKIEKGRVTAKVQGSRRTPYKVTIDIPLIPGEAWKKIAKSFSDKIYYAAKLISGEIPQDIEEIFNESGVSLFPKKSKDIKTSCSCPDWSNPCKHIAAVFYLMAEEFDRDPFLIFKMRGLEKEELMTLIDRETDGLFSDVKQKQPEELPDKKKKTRKTGDAKTKKNEKTKSAKTKKTDKKLKESTEEPNIQPDENLKESSIEPISAEPSSFWKGSRQIQISSRIEESPSNKTEESSFSKIQKPLINAALPKRLGNFPFWRGNDPFLKTMETIYANASESSESITFCGIQRK
jgi:uncharacterized Zn finger protein